jgi:hypothetical protein
LNTTPYAPPPKFLKVLGYVALWLVLGLGLWRLFAGTHARRPDLLLYLILVAVAGTLWLATVINRLILRSRLAAPKLTVLSARPCLGEHVTFDLRLEARRPVLVGKVVALLSFSEEVRKAQRREKILPVVVYRKDSVLAENLRLGKGEAKHLAGELVIPADGMQSFESHLCATRWQLDLLVFVGRHLAWREREILSVQPVRLEVAEKTA